MPYFLLTFGDASRPPVGAVIVEATSMFRARMTAVERRLTACTGLAVSELFCTDSAVPKVQIFMIKPQLLLRGKSDDGEVL